MSTKKNIVSIANLGLAWGLKEIRALLSSRSDLKKDVKVVFMKLEGLQKTTVTRIASSLAGSFNPSAALLKEILQRKNWKRSSKISILSLYFKTESL